MSPRERAFACAATVALALGGCPAKAPEAPPPPPPPPAAHPGLAQEPHERGIASFYHLSLAGRPTASGEPFDPDARTCAHQTLPLGTRVLVTVKKTRKSAECTVNDRGPYAKKRILDLAPAMRAALDLPEDKGVVRIELRVLGDDKAQP